MKNLGCNSSILGLVLGVLVALAWGGESTEAVLESARSELRVALDELTSLRSQIESQRIALAKRLTELEQSIAEERTRLQRLQREEGNQMVLLGMLRSEVNSISNDVRAVASILSEYRRSFESRLNISEQQKYQETIRTAAAASESMELKPADNIGRQLDFVVACLERLEELIGGRRFDGRAVVPSGVVEPGTFLLLGPSAYFVSSTSGTGGFVEQRLNSADANVAELSPHHVSELKEVVTSGTGRVPFDPTLGNAIRIRSVRDPIGTHIKKGGPVMIPILILGAAAIVLFVIKWVEVSRVRAATPTELEDILGDLECGSTRKARERARKIVGPVGEMLDVAIVHSGEPREYVEEVMYERMIATKPRLERFVPFLALVAGTAPLLGLLGTVTGMINTFNLITIFGTGDPKTLAGGISEALITTEFGLIVAVSALLLHALISRKVKAVLASMEQTMAAFINGLDGVESRKTEGEENHDRSHFKHLG